MVTNCRLLILVSLVSLVSTIVGTSEMTMSTVYEGIFPASLCFDKIEIGKNFCHTELERYPWLSIKLPKPVRTKRISVINRNDCCPERFREAVVIVGTVSPVAKNQIFTSGTQLGEKFPGGLGKGETHDFVSNEAVEGNVITVQLQTTEYLQLSEVIIHEETNSTLGDVRLDSNPRGRIEIFGKTGWGTLCGHYWWDNDHGANNICKQLGYAAGGTFYMGHEARGEGTIATGNRLCSGGEKTIFDCPLQRDEFSGCSHAYDVGVSCKEDTNP